MQRSAEGSRTSAARPLHGRLHLLLLHGRATWVLRWLTGDTRPAVPRAVLLLLVVNPLLLLLLLLRPALLPLGRAARVAAQCCTPTAACRPARRWATRPACCASLLPWPIVSVGLEARLLRGSWGSASTCHFGLLWRRRLGGCPRPCLCS